MDSQYPKNVINKILEITLETQRFCYISFSDSGALVNKGGKFTPSLVSELSTNNNTFSSLPFIQSFIDSDENLDFIPLLDLGDDTIVDAHLFKDNELIWLILIDKSETLMWQSEARQKSNELRLLEEKYQHKQSKVQAFVSEVDFVSALNIIALLKNDDGSFSLLRPASECFKSIYPESFDVSKPIHPQNKFLFLENFLVDAQDFWKTSDDQHHLNSGPWVEQDSNGVETALEATAAKAGANELLFIKKLSTDYQAYQNVLQIGREGVLIKNQLEDEVRMRTKTIRAREEEIALRLVCAADKRDDGETGSHIRRLGLYSELMAKHLGWPQEKVDEIRIAAPMHDIGKIGIPDYILRKPGKLSGEEYEIMKQHPIIGGQILSNSNSGLVQMAREISLGHHEKWDGSGYPYGLAGENIHITARIVAIVDVFDALIHKRVYKDKVPLDKAIEMMYEGRGTHFDPTLFDLFIQLKDEMVKIANDYHDPLISDSSVAAATGPHL